MVQFFKDFEQWEKYNPSSFWLFTIGLWLTIKSFAFGALSPASEVPCQSQVVVGQLRAGGSSDRIGIQKMDLTLHRLLERHFPDWEERMAYQEKQAKLYKSARKKKKEIIKLRIKDNSSFYSEKELDSIRYFEGKGYYARCQDPSVAPNIFDTRQSFLLKMHNTTAREKFLKSFNRVND